jgi:hypothetical protein
MSMDLLLHIQHPTIQAGNTGIYFPPSLIAKNKYAASTNETSCDKVTTIHGSKLLYWPFNVTTVSYVQKLLHCINIYLDFRNTENERNGNKVPLSPLKHKFQHNKETCHASSVYVIFLHS